MIFSVAANAIAHRSTPHIHPEVQTIEAIESIRCVIECIDFTLSYLTASMQRRKVVCQPDIRRYAAVLLQEAGIS